MYYDTNLPANEELGSGLVILGGNGAQFSVIKQLHVVRLKQFFLHI